jgi:HSP20 family protein
MQNLTKKQILAVSAALFLGFTFGFAGRDILDHSGSAKASEPVVMPEFLGMQLDVPKVKTIDGDKEIQVVAEVPGMSEKDVDVQAGKNTVTISGHRKETTGDDARNSKKSFSTLEQSFTRTVSLPVEVDGDKVKATIKDGVLTVSIPKAKTNKAI